MRRIHSIVIAVVIGLFIQGCGLKGPLRLPDRAKPTATDSAQTNVPAREHSTEQ